MPGSGRTQHHAIIKPVPAVLDVVAVVSNPARYRSRYDLFRAFESHVVDSGARLTVVELAFGGRPFEVTRAGEPRHVRLRSDHELWHKENLINLGIGRCPEDSEYVAWVDADVTFQRHDWVQETIQQLQHFPVVQMWSHSQNLGPDSQPMNAEKGFVYSYRNRLATGPGYTFWHPGFAWAARREAIDQLGGLIDWAILGAADHHMARALIGQAPLSISHETRHALSPGYMRRLAIWQDRAERHIRRNIGYVPGLLVHHWHGKLKDRRYKDRWQILVENDYDPDLDVKADSRGVLQLTDRSAGLRDGIRGYFRARNEDSIDA